ncbi:protein rolling stone-like [Saccostrea echinata]|uniref:protein rolling stone-like n=1 Tax=Saccostrea echinata TaxID=191078 RepID=UPI002A823166|nr:protein rolling stone-like [Saccostrea echinata]
MTREPDDTRRLVSCLKRVKKEFSRENFRLEYEYPVDFVKLQYGPSVLFIVWSVCWAILHVLGLGLQPYFYRNYDFDLKWFSYLTYWGYTTLCVFTLWDSVAAIYVHIRRQDIIRGECKAMPWYLKAVWVQFNVNTPIALVITILFYLFIPNDTSPNSILVHAMNTVYVSANVIVCAKPMRMLHVFHPLLYGIVYLIFSVIYQKTTGHVVYTQLNWDNMPQTALFMLGILLLILPFLYFMCLLVTRLRTLLHTKLCKKKTSSIAPSQLQECPNESNKGIQLGYA